MASKIPLIKCYCRMAVHLKFDKSKMKNKTDTKRKTNDENIEKCAFFYEKEFKKKPKINPNEIVHVLRKVSK